jgi:hypothetical protein
MIAFCRDTGFNNQINDTHHFTIKTIHPSIYLLKIWLNDHSYKQTRAAQPHQLTQKHRVFFKLTTSIGFTISWPTDEVHGVTRKFTVLVFNVSL